MLQRYHYWQISKMHEREMQHTKIMLCVTSDTFPNNKPWYKFVIMPPPPMIGGAGGGGGKRDYVRICFRSISLSCLKGFSNNLAEVITIMRRCVARKNQVPRSKVKATLKGQRTHITALEDFHVTWQKWSQFSRAITRSLEPRSRSHSKVKCHI